MCLSANPFKAGDARVGGEGASVKAEAEIGELAEGLDARRPEPHAPGSPLDRAPLGECAAGEERDIGPVPRVADGFISDAIEPGLARRIGKNLAGAIVGQMCPARA